MSKHTPGPWTFDDNRNGSEGLVAVWGTDGSLVASLGDMEDCEWSAINDAHLIAAAPDLLAACKDAYTILWAAFGPADAPYTPDALAAMTTLRAAIARVEGAQE